MKDQNEKYSCAECSNAATALCEGCRSVVSPSGRETKPTRHVEMARFDFDTVRIDALSHMIGRQIKLGGSIPLSWVVEYNERVGRCERLRPYDQCVYTDQAMHSQEDEHSSLLRSSIQE